MTITFPRPWCEKLAIVGMAFPIQPMIEITPLRSGTQISADLGPALWRPKYLSAKLNHADFGSVRAWYASLLSAESFLGYDNLRQYPLAYAGGWPSSFAGFDGTCRLQGVTNSKAVNLDSLPAGFVFSEGDYIAFDYASAASRALHRIVSGGTADAFGAVAVEVRPFVRTGWEADAIVDLYRPSAEFIILPGTYDETSDINGYGSISFEAIQTL